MIGLSLRVNRAAAKAGLAPGELRRVLQIALTADGALDVQRFLSASESIGLTTDAALIVLRELAGSPSFSLTTSGVLDAATFDPLSLFASGEEGAWHEPSTTTAFSDLEGFNFATYGQGVAHLVDKSKGATIEARRNLLTDTENFVPATSSWEVLSVASTFPTVLANQDGDADRVTFGTIDATGDLSILRYPVESLTTAGPTYTISVELKANDAAQIGKTVFFYQNDATGVLTYTTHTLTSDYVRISVTGTWASTTRFISLATDGGSRFGNEGALTDTNAIALVRSIQLEAGSTATAYQKITTGQTISWLPGNHATQVTAGARPILARVPPRGRVNELSETDTLATQSVTVTAAQRTLSFKGTGTVTLSGASTAGLLVGTGAEDRVSLTFTPSSGTLTLTVSGTVTDAQLELGSAVTNYQLVADLLGYDITEAGVTSLEYLSFNGASNGMATASIDFTATDKMSVFAGVEKESDATLGQLVELSATVVTNSGSFSMPSAVSGASWDVFVKGTGTLRSATATSFAAPIKTVNTGLYDLALATGDAKIRVDGTLRATSAGDTGGGNFGNYPLYIGARAASSLFFDGKIFGLIVRGAASTTNEISNTEAYLANRSGVTL